MNVREQHQNEKATDMQTLAETQTGIRNCYCAKIKMHL